MRIFLTRWSALLCMSVVWASAAPGLIEAEIGIYGATSAGVTAAIQASRMGRSVFLVSASAHVGGLTTSGLGATDIGHKAAIGGIAREFYQRVARHYAQPDAWAWETAEAYFARRRSGQIQASALTGPEATMWTFEPRVAAQVLEAMLAEARVTVVRSEELSDGVCEAGRLRELRTRSGARFRARIFIDASYEGDLMPLAGVRYHVGRESNHVYGETLNGVRAQTPHHQFTVAVDPYTIPGRPESGLLPGIQPGDGGEPGSGDHRVQAYNYRLCFTTNAANRWPVEPPPGYQPKDYTLLARYLEALEAAGRKPTLAQLWHPLWMPNGKTDINNNGAFSTDYIGENHGYPEASPAERRRIVLAHEHYLRGWITFLATDPRVPARIREEMPQWGPCRDEFSETRGWPRELYVREARRMVGAYVMTEHECRGLRRVDDPMALAAYNMDSHNCQRIVRAGRVVNEGDVQVPPMQPYPIAYRAMRPRAEECANLLVPVCLSASHIAYGSIRMEPVFMILGQSAATAACLALDRAETLATLDYTALRSRLLRDRQVLSWPP